MDDTDIDLLVVEIAERYRALLGAIYAFAGLGDKESAKRILAQLREEIAEET